MPAAPKIPDWLGYIRPHIRPYDALGRGERRDYIAKLSKETKLSDNSLRRMIFAAQFLEEEGIKELPPDGKMPVGAVERVARIAARRAGKAAKAPGGCSRGQGHDPATQGSTQEKRKGGQTCAQGARRCPSGRKSEGRARLSRYRRHQENERRRHPAHPGRVVF